MSSNRRLAAILFADIVGYTAMMQRNEREGLAKVRRFNQVVGQEVKACHGEVLKFMGDGCLCIFHSAVQAMHAARAIQEAFRIEPRVPLRIGIHLGDVVLEDGNIYGDGVNLASRVESMGVPGSVLVTERIIHDIRSHPEFKMVSLGKFRFKNVEKPMELFGLANEGFVLPKRSQMKGKGSPARNLVSKIGPLALLIGVLVLVLGLGYRMGHQPAAIVPDRSIALLPFQNLSPDPQQDYFGDGISQDILTNLSGIQDLQVISFNASKKYRNSSKSTREIGAELSAKHLLSGSVQQDGDRLRIRVMLVDVETDRQVWGKRYDKSMEDIFQIQAEVSYEIAEVLKAELLPAAAARIKARPTESIDAWQEYNQGRYQWELRTDEGLKLAEAHFFKALALDSAFALAYTGLAQVYQVHGTNPDNDQAFFFQKSKQFAEKALAFNPEIADAYAVLGGYYGWHEIDYPRSNALFKTAIDLEPGNETAHQWFAEILLNQGDVAGARQEVEIAKRLDPGSRIIAFVDATVLMGEDQYQEACRKLEELHGQYPEVGTITWFLLETYLYTGQLEKAFTIKGLPTDQHGYPYTLLFETHHIEALKQWNALNPGTGWYPYRTENDILLLSGGVERYIARMDSAFFVYRFMDPGTFQYFPPPDSVRLHPDFKTLMRKGNFSVRPRAKTLEEGLVRLRKSFAERQRPERVKATGPLTD